ESGRHRQPELSGDGSDPTTLGQQGSDGFLVRREGAWPSKLDSVPPGGPQAGFDAVLDDGPLEFGDGHENTQLQAACRVVVARVDSLAGTDERDAMRRQFRHQLGQMRKTATKPVQLKTDDHVKAPPSNVSH